MTERYYVYILASRYRGTLYVGVTNDMIRRASEHRSGAAEGFTRRYKCTFSSMSKSTIRSWKPARANIR